MSSLPGSRELDINQKISMSLDEISKYEKSKASSSKRKKIKKSSSKTRHNMTVVSFRNTCGARHNRYQNAHHQAETNSELTSRMMRHNARRFSWWHRKNAEDRMDVVEEASTPSHYKRMPYSYRPMQLKTYKFSGYTKMRKLNKVGRGKKEDNTKLLDMVKFGYQLDMTQREKAQGSSKEIGENQQEKKSEI